MSKQITTASVLVYCSIFVASSIYVMIPLQPLLADIHQVSLNYVSLASTFFVLPYAFGLLFFGILADHIPPRTILLVGMTLLTAVTGLLSFVDSINSLIALRVVQGIVAASFAPVSYAYSFAFFKSSLQALVIALINTGFLFAGVFGQMIAAFFANSFHYQAVFIAFFCFYVTCLIGMLFSLRQTTFQSNNRSKHIFSSILSCFKHPALQKLYIIAFFLLLTVMTFYGSFEIFIYNDWEDFPFSVQLFRLISLIGIFPAFFSSRLIQHFGAIRVLRVQLGVMVIGFVPALITLNVATILFASFMMIVSTSLTIPMVVLLVGENASTYKSTAIALYSFVLLTGASFGSTLATYLPFTTVLILIPIGFLALSFFTKWLPSE